MKREAEVKSLLITNAIHSVAEGGFENATTKELTHCSGHLAGLKMNEVYLYRIFGSKENLFEAAFIQLDEELYRAFKNGVTAIGGFDDYTDEKMYQFFLRAWNYILQNEEKLRYYVRYYYSIYFKDRSLKLHERHFDRISSEMEMLFKDEADANSILHSVFTALLDFAIRVCNGQLEDNDINRPHIFNVLYCMMLIYFKDSVKVTGEIKRPGLITKNEIYTA